MRRKKIVDNAVKNPTLITKRKKEKKLKIAATVILYEPEESIKENIESYLNDVEIVYVIDNSINKDHQDKLPKSKKIVYINNKRNLGIATALNIGCKKALEDKFEFILTMDQDSKFEGENLKILIDFANEHETKKIGIISPYHEIKTNIKEKNIDVEYPIEVMTSGNLLNLEAYKNIKGFKDEMFIDCVDIELCMNLRVNGYEVIRYNKARLRHELGNSKIYNFIIKKVVTSNHNAIRRYYITRNILYTHQMYYDYFPEYCDYIKRILKYQARNILLFERHKYKKIRNMLRGYKDFKRDIKGEYNYSD